MSANRTSITVRLPDALVARLDAACDERVVGRNLIVTRAVEHYLDRLPPLATPEQLQAEAELAHREAQAMREADERAQHEGGGL